MVARFVAQPADGTIAHVAKSLGYHTAGHEHFKGNFIGFWRSRIIILMDAAIAVGCALVIAATLIASDDKTVACLRRAG